MSKKQKTGIQKSQVYSDEFISLYRLEDADIVLCIADTEYIPISYFKKSFEKIGELIIENGWKALIFDKRKLNTFHQPSMEWYYTEWKAQMLEYGLNAHYKILPAMSWFAKSVDAGKRDIQRNHPSFDFDAFSVTYVDSIEEALEHYKNTQ